MVRRKHASWAHSLLLFLVALLLATTHAHAIGVGAPCKVCGESAPIDSQETGTYE